MDNVINNTNEIEKMLQDIKPILNATQVVINDMNDRDRKPVKQMATMVGIAIGMEPVKALPFVNYFAHNTIAGYVSPGKFGGFVKGTRPLKAAKITNNTVVDNTALTNDTIESIIDEEDTE